MDEEVLLKALRLLEQGGKAVIIESEDHSSMGVKIFSKVS